VSADRNRELIRRIFEDVWNGTGRAEDVLAEVPEHATFHYRTASIETGRDSLRDLVAEWRAAFPDLVFEIHDLVGEGDVVAIRLTYRGTHLGPWRGLEPTGRSIEVGEMMFFRFDGHVLVEMWELDDHATMTQQLTSAD
jgi:predicted ester cyclase